MSEIATDNQEIPEYIASLQIRLEAREIAEKQNQLYLDSFKRINQFCREDMDRGNEASALRILTLTEINRVLAEANNLLVIAMNDETLPNRSAE